MQPTDLSHQFRRQERQPVLENCPRGKQYVKYWTFPNRVVFYRAGLQKARRSRMLSSLCNAASCALTTPPPTAIFKPGQLEENYINRNQNAGVVIQIRITFHISSVLQRSDYLLAYPNLSAGNPPRCMMSPARAQSGGRLSENIGHVISCCGCGW